MRHSHTYYKERCGPEANIGYENCFWNDLNIFYLTFQHGSNPMNASIHFYDDSLKIDQNKIS